MAKFEEELELLLKCKTPIIEVVTYEWQRLQSTVNVISGNNLTKWKRWNRSVGIVDSDGNVEPILDPIQLLKKFKEGYGNNHKSIGKVGSKPKTRIVQGYAI